MSYIGLLLTCIVAWLVLRWVWTKFIKPAFRREITIVRTSLIATEMEKTDRLDDN